MKFDKSVSVKYIKSYKFLKLLILKAYAFKVIHTQLQVSYSKKKMFNLSSSYFKRRKRKSSGNELFLIF